MDEGSVPQNIEVSGVVPNLRVEHASLKQATFNDVRMSGARFDNSNLQDGVVHNCNLNGLRVRACDIEGMTIDGIPVKRALLLWENSARR